MRSILAGGLATVLPKINWTARLSVISWKREPNKYSQNFSHPQTAASASFSH
jgi:hypothetical protein